MSYEYGHSMNNDHLKFRDFQKIFQIHENKENYFYEADALKII